jgi:hypothetical protein
MGNFIKLLELSNSNLRGFPAISPFCLLVKAIRAHGKQKQVLCYIL